MRLTPCVMRISAIMSHLSAITESPGSRIFKRLLLMVSSRSDMLPRYSLETKLIAPEGVIPINTECLLLCNGTGGLLNEDLSGINDNTRCGVVSKRSRHCYIYLISRWPNAHFLKFDLPK